jgi:hypothetical protein
MRRIMRLGAQTMRAQVWHDDAVSRIGQCGSVAIFNPVGVRFGYKPMDQQQRPPLPRFAPRDLDAVNGLETIARNHQSYFAFWNLLLLYCHARLGQESFFG